MHAQDTEQLISRHDLDDYVIASLSLYLDILNLFLKVPPLSFPVAVAMFLFVTEGCRVSYTRSLPELSVSARSSSSYWATIAIELQAVVWSCR